MAKKSEPANPRLSIHGGPSSQSICQAKVSFAGSSGVGKTSIINRFMNDSFSSVFKSNTGAGNYHKEQNGINLNIWDVPGQDQYASTTKQHL